MANNRYEKKRRKKEGAPKRPLAQSGDFIVSSFESSDKVNTISYYIKTPSVPTRGVVHILHGWFESSQNYELISNMLVARGFAVCAQDLSGHGKSLCDDKNIHCFTQRDSDIYLINDIAHLQSTVREKFRHAPYIILGQGLGALCARVYAENYGDDIDGLVLASMAPDLEKSGFSGRIIKLASLLNSGKRSRAMQDRFFSLLSNSKQNSAAFIVNPKPKMTIVYNNGALTDMLRMREYISRENWFENTDKSIPILCAYGSKDPFYADGNSFDSFSQNANEFSFSRVDLMVFDDLMQSEIFGDKNMNGLGSVCDWIEETVAAASAQKILDPLSIKANESEE